MDAIVDLRGKQLRIMECLDKLSSGSRGQNKGKDHPPVASPTAADHMAYMLDTPQTLFDMPQQTLVHLGLAIRWEQDPSLSKSNSRDHLLGVPLHGMPPISALR